ncbi:cholesterol oxidase substrate-binding domain-containing protein [Serratia entomophila]|uniref:cholesterol oxidase substrate-binding domain-containing protein n=1 Tax=Serratia entomophila TaxID=42906 RepID=UPI002179519F|nr:cholesterol oxidase substrate-binding domain-containing protein [Serratia entomophila]CAI1144217.1 plant-specific FAD-dependent oxidoreductase [Serratia entomophila]CAI1886022.1 plant-specific FAD-dependent oxidoreductase [Serratia entomophila]CAI1886893.1 plant-specific FAD-dependent oxidoreductase [Serratia entomophila]CAI1949340.1 plant-specific FAD-dependent oxidoreductase [Serratia entomophila]CAI1978146.1 plant-specific FAD-dependent oxidoreductase [Serratia entomophila]
MMNESNSRAVATPSLPIKSYYSDFTNWSQETVGRHILTCAPASSDELLKVVNWAYQNNYKVRPLGMKHNWSQLTIAGGENNGNVLLVDLTKSLNKMTIIEANGNGTFKAQTGILMEDLLTQLEKKKLGFLAYPAPGDLTLGGVLAIGGHGTCVPAKGETLPAGGSFGSLSNSIVSLTAVVWDEAGKSYVLKTFQRNEQDITAFMVHVGRALIYEVTMQVPRNKRLRCQSYVNIPATELFAKDAAGKRSFSHYLDQCGRAEAIWFPFTENPWLKIWTETPSYPNVSKPVHSPFNYPFSDNLPKSISDVIKQINNGHPELTPTLGKLQAELVSVGLGATLSFDLWGWSKDLLLYVKPSTLRVTANGYAILTKRANVQSVLYDFVTKYNQMVAAYQSKNSYPMNGPIEIRVTGLDQPAESIVAGAMAPALSALRPHAGKPEWDVAVWLDILTMPDTPDANKFYQEMETWIFSHFSGDYAATRVEWSKGWAYTPEGTWVNSSVIGNNIPTSLGAGAPGGNDWNKASTILNRYDPHRLFSSPLIERLFPI